MSEDECCGECMSVLLAQECALRVAGITRARLMLTGPPLGKRIKHEQRKRSITLWRDVGYGDKMRSWRADGLHLGCARAYVARLDRVANGST